MTAWPRAPNCPAAPPEPGRQAPRPETGRATFRWWSLKCPPAARPGPPSPRLATPRGRPEASPQAISTTALSRHPRSTTPRALRTRLAPALRLSKGRSSPSRQSELCHVRGILPGDPRRPTSAGTAWIGQGGSAERSCAGPRARPSGVRCSASRALRGPPCGGLVTRIDHPYRSDGSRLGDRGRRRCGWERAPPTPRTRARRGGGAAQHPARLDGTGRCSSLRRLEAGQTRGDDPTHGAHLPQPLVRGVVPSGRSSAVSGWTLGDPMGVREDRPMPSTGHRSTAALLEVRGPGPRSQRPLSRTLRRVMSAVSRAARTPVGSPSSRAT